MIEYGQQQCVFPHEWIQSSCRHACSSQIGCGTQAAAQQHGCTPTNVHAHSMPGCEVIWLNGLATLL